MAAELSTFLEEHIARSVTAMLATAQEMCPNVLQHDSRCTENIFLLVSKYFFTVVTFFLKLVFKIFLCV